MASLGNVQGIPMMDERVKSTIEKISNCKDFLQLNVSILLDLYNMLATYPGYHVCTGIINGYIDMTINDRGLLSIWIVRGDKEYKFSISTSNVQYKKIKDLI